MTKNTVHTGNPQVQSLVTPVIDGKDPITKPGVLLIVSVVNTELDESVD